MRSLAGSSPRHFGVASAGARATGAASAPSRPQPGSILSTLCPRRTQCGGDSRQLPLLLQQCRRRRSLGSVVVAASTSQGKTRRPPPRSTIDMPDGLRAPPYTGSPEQLAAVSRLLERSKSIGGVDEETAIWVRKSLWIFGL